MVKMHIPICMHFASRETPADQLPTVDVARDSRGGKGKHWLTTNQATR